MREYKPGCHEYYMKLARLKQFVKWCEEHELSDDTPVCIERIEDEYFKSCGWNTFDHFEMFEDFEGNTPQRFFQAWDIGLSRDKQEILIHGHF